MYEWPTHCDDHAQLATQNAQPIQLADSHLSSKLSILFCACLHMAHHVVYCIARSNYKLPYPRERGPMGGAPYIGPKLGDGGISITFILHSCQVYERRDRDNVELTRAKRARKFNHAHFRMTTPTFERSCIAIPTKHRDIGLYTDWNSIVYWVYACTTPPFVQSSWIPGQCCKIR